MNRMKACVMAVVMIVCALAPMKSLCVSAEDVKVSNQEYDVYYTGKHSSFLCNKKTVGNEVGTEYYMTYTVERASSSGLQNGFLGTCAPETQFPYTDGNGTLYYEQRKTDKDEAPLLLEGYTYFVKFTVTESGFRYLASRAKGDSSEYVVIEKKHTDGEAKDTNYGYFGLWLGVGVTDAHLTHVRFYDKEGNDLGVWSPWSKAIVAKSGVTAKDKKVDHWYRITAVDLTNLAISNEMPLTTDKMYIEYTVSETSSTCRQTGVAFSNYPNSTYPHSNGQLRYQGKDDEVDCMLLEQGADYLITLEKGAYGFNAYVQITKNSKTTFKVFPSISGAYDSEAQFFSLWFGQGADWKANFVLDNVKIYDSNKNNLGVQSNNTALQIRHFGSMLDYAACEAIYYCQEDESTYTLFENKTMIYEKGNTKVEGTYSIRNNEITLVSEDKKETYDYLYRGFTAKEDRYYKRLYTYNVSFVAGNGSAVEIQTMDMMNGYKAKKPTNPQLEGCTFEGWCTIERTNYDFDMMVTESKTLYAKWSDDAGVEYIAVGENEIVALDTLTSYVIVILCAVLPVIAVVVSIFIIRGGLKGGKKEKER